ncbi:hypothetical protein M8818_001479 [Zalaria obscura]|uniref:Uncharacterized protein n=1 Tax=Zalaria obscura TaxID=2024903 RepID=A0ACC3SKU4_9PEZI
MLLSALLCSDPDYNGQRHSPLMLSSTSSLLLFADPTLTKLASTDWFSDHRHCPVLTIMSKVGLSAATHHMEALSRLEGESSSSPVELPIDRLRHSKDESRWSSAEVTLNNQSRCSNAPETPRHVSGAPFSMVHVHRFLVSPTESEASDAGSDSKWSTSMVSEDMDGPLSHIGVLDHHYPALDRGTRIRCTGKRPVLRVVTTNLTEPQHAVFEGTPEAKSPQSSPRKHLGSPIVSQMKAVLNWLDESDQDKASATLQDIADAETIKVHASPSLLPRKTGQADTYGCPKPVSRSSMPHREVFVLESPHQAHHSSPPAATRPYTCSHLEAEVASADTPTAQHWFSAQSAMFDPLSAREPMARANTVAFPRKPMPSKASYCIEWTNSVGVGLGQMLVEKMPENAFENAFENPRPAPMPPRKDSYTEVIRLAKKHKI